MSCLVGLEDREWFRAAAREDAGSSLSRGWLIASALVALAVACLVSPRASGVFGYELPFGIGQAEIGLHHPQQTRADSAARPLYPAGDPWRAWLADENTCPGGELLSASVAAQRETMLCLINFARRRQGLGFVTLTAPLTAAATAKGHDIVRCGEFEHEACGKPADKVARDIGYEGAFGENLYAAGGPYGAPRVALDRWLNSAGHRKNLFRTEWRTAGLALLPGADFGPYRDGALWVSHFGVR